MTVWVNVWGMSWRKTLTAPTQEANAVHGTSCLSFKCPYNQIREAALPVLQTSHLYSCLFGSKKRCMSREIWPSSSDDTTQCEATVMQGIGRRPRGNTKALGSHLTRVSRNKEREGSAKSEHSPFMPSQLAASVEGLGPQSKLQRKKLVFFWGSEILTPWLLPCGVLPSCKRDKRTAQRPAMYCWLVWFSNYRKRHVLIHWDMFKLSMINRELCYKMFLIPILYPFWTWCLWRVSKTPVNQDKYSGHYWRHKIC